MNFNRANSLIASGIRGPVSQRRLTNQFLTLKIRVADQPGVSARAMDSLAMIAELLFGNPWAAPELQCQLATLRKDFRIIHHA